MEPVRLFTVGFTKKSAEKFFSLLGKAGAKRVVDVRLHNASQLAGFAKRDDLRYFLRALLDIDYEHRVELAPTPEILDAYKKEGGRWEAYEEPFLKLLKERRVEETLSPRALRDACLLCSEDPPDHCHRRLVAEYLKRHWRDVEIVHLR